METSKIIKNIRSELGLTQKEFASKIGSNRDNVASYETQRAIPPGNVMIKILKLGYWLVPKRNISSLY